MSVITPSLAVAIPAYKRPDTLRQLLRSIPSRIRVTVSDNGGLLPAGICEEHAGATVKNTPDVLPMFANWNRAVNSCTEDYIVNPSDDDLFLPGAFDAIEDALRRHPDADLLVFGHRNIDESGADMSGWAPESDCREPAPLGFLRFSTSIPARMPSIVFRRSLFNRLGGYNETFSLTAGDSDLIQRMLLEGSVVWSPRTIACYRVWDGGLTAQKQATELWMKEVETWTNRVGLIAERLLPAAKIPFNRQTYADRILADNLLAAYASARKRQCLGAAAKQLHNVRFPSQAPLKHRLKLLATRWLVACIP